MPVSTPETGPRSRARASAVGWILAPNLVLGVPAYFVAFLFAYGFQDSVGLGEHLTFLVLIAIVAVISGVVGAAIMAAAAPELSAAQRAAFCVPMSLALHLVAVGVGSIVSATHKEEGSVSAEFSTLADVMIAGGLLALAVAFAAVALRAGRG